MNCRSLVTKCSASVASLLILFASTINPELHAQVAGGMISGTVTDNTARVIPNAEVNIKNVATGVTREVTTNTDGVYVAPNLVPGTYELKFEAKGFKSETKRNMALTVGASQIVDATMNVGTTIETVEVTSEAPAIQLSTSDISAVVDATTVRELPLNGRSWTDLATLQPGVDAIHTQPDFAAGTDRGNRGFGQQLTISGARPQQNNYRLDGVSLNDYANGAPGSVLGGNLGVDAIQEFSVLTSNYSAEYGKTSGGVVNAVTRSGTNELHGSAYEFLRNSSLDAKNFFDDRTRKIPPFRRNQFGGAIGGPIQKNRTFFFADYEGIRQSTGISTLTFVPSQNARAGQLCSNPAGADPSNPCIPTTVTVDPAASSFFTFYHTPNGPAIGNGDTAQYTFAGQQIVNENFVTARADHKFSNNDSLFGTYMFDRTPYASPDGLNNVEFTTLTARQFAALEETHIFSPGFVNSIRLGGNHETVNNNESLTAINTDAARKDLGVGGTAFAGRAAPQVLVGGLTDFTGGVGGSPTYFYHWNSIQLYDDAFWTKGTHSIRFGAAVERMMLNVLADTDPNGIWNFDNVAGFLTNQPTKFQGGIASTLSPRNLRETLFGAYVQDDWRARTNLTLNLGLRYEISTVVRETAGKLANLPTVSAATAHLGNPFFSNPTLRDFEPRVGFAWDLFSNGKTALRGGVGLFDVQPLPYQFPLLVTQAIPFFSYTVVKDPFGECGCTSPFPNFGGLNISFPANRLRSTFVDPKPKRNYVMQWNLNLQQQITPSLAGMVAYVGSRGVHQPFRVDDINMVIPPKTSAGYVFPNVTDPTDPNFGGPVDPVNPNLSSIRGMFYNGHSYYNAMEVQLAKRMSHGFQVQGTFTWAKSMDTSSATVAGDAFGNSISSLHWFDLRLSRGLSDFNVGRTFVVNGTWEVPTPKSFSGPAKWALGGWELGLIFTATDGVPFTPSWGTGNDPSNTNSGDDWAFPNRLSTSNCKTLTNPGNPLAYVKNNCFQVPTAPDLAFWNANCNPAPPSLVDSGGNPIIITHPLDPKQDGAGWLPALPCFNLRGNAGRNILNGPGLTELDFSLFKNNYIRRISEHFNVQFRAEVFNILNHVNFGPPSTPTNTDIFDATGAPNQIAGALTKTTTTARQIQFAIKFIF